MGQTIKTDIEVALKDYDKTFQLDGCDAEIVVRSDGTLVVIDYEHRHQNLSGEVFFAAPGAWLWGSVIPLEPKPISSSDELATRLVAYDQRRAAFNPEMAGA